MISRPDSSIAIEFAEPAPHNTAAGRLDIQWGYNPTSGILVVKKGTAEAIRQVGRNTAYIGTHLGMAIEDLDQETVDD